jgi:hypothetical protein
MVVDRYMKDIHGMQNIPDTGFEEASRGSFNFIGVLFHTGVIGDNDDLFVLDPKISQRLNDFDVCFEILYQLSKLRGRPYVSWQEVLIDSDYYQRGQLMILRRHFYSPEIWTGETNFCSPNDKLIQYAVQRVNEVREKRK